MFATRHTRSAVAGIGTSRTPRASVSALMNAAGEPIAPASPQPFTPSGLWVHGGLAQGLGQAMLEGCAYDPESGQLLTGSYMDYTMPRADDLPKFTVGTNVTPCTHNPLGVKGCGEAGAIGSPPAVINAITDAIGTNDLSMPATPQKVWAAARAAKH